MVALASAFIRLRPETDKAEFTKAGRDGADAAGKGMRDAKGQFVKAGQNAGSGFGDGFKRDVNGKLRDANGKFVKEFGESGAQGGKKFASGFNKHSSGIIGGLKANLGAAAGLFVPLGIAAAVGEIGKIGIEYENNLNIFQSVTKATAKEMKAVAAQARALGADIELPGVSAAGAAAAMSELGKAGFTVAESMDAAKATLQLARVANLSEADAAEIAANAVNAFGIKAKDTTFVVDELAAAANSSSIEISDASLAFKQAAAVFSGTQGPAIGAKESITELNTAIAILGNNGIKGSDAGTSLKQMLLQLTGPSSVAKSQMALLAQKAAGANVSLKEQNDILHGSAKVRREALADIAKHNKGIKDTGDIAYDSAGRMRPLRDIIKLTAAGTKDMTQEDRNFAITQIFGADASRAVLALLKGGLPVYDKQRKAILQQGAAADFAKAKNAGLGGAIDNVKSQIENASISIYNVIKGPLTNALNGLAEQLPGFFNSIGAGFGFMAKHITTVKVFAGALALLTLITIAHGRAMAIEAAGGVLKYISSIRIVTAVTKVWAGVQWVLDAALAANPIGIVVIAIAALVAGIVIAYKNSETFRKIVQAAWAGIKTAVGAVVGWFTGTVWPAMKAAWDGIATGAIWLWKNAILPAWNGIMAVVTFVVNVVKAAIGAVVAAFRFVAGIAIWLWKNIFTPVFNAIGKVVEIWWLAVRVVFAALKLFIVAVLTPVFQGFRVIIGAVFGYIATRIATWWAGVKVIFNLFRTYVIGPVYGALVTARNFFAAVFGAVGRTISAWWTGTVKPKIDLAKAAWSALAGAFSSIYTTKIRPLFQAFIGFIGDKLVGGFKKGVDAIRDAWAKVQEAARKPVAFVVNHVINPFITGLNRAAKLVGIKDQVATIGGFAGGGQIPGVPSLRDNRIAGGPAGPIAVASGEYITNTRSTLANLPLVQAINNKRGKVTRADVDPFLDGYAHGGMVGDGIGDFFGKVIDGAKGVGSFIANPKAGLANAANAVLGQIPGSGMLVDVVRGAARKLVNSAGNWLKDKLSGGGGLGGAGVAGGWQGMRNLIGARFPGLNMISGPRTGARTLSGNRSYHAIGRAVDYPPLRALAAWIKSTFGARTKELITPYQDLNLHNGRPHTYTGAIWNQHNFAGGNAHVHWAARDGGMVGAGSGMPVKLFDQGGFWPSGTLGANMSGRTEYVSTGVPGGGPVEIHLHNHGIIGSQKQMDSWLSTSLDRLKRERRLPGGTTI